MASIPAERTKFLCKWENWHRFVFSLISEEFCTQQVAKPHNGVPKTACSWPERWAQPSPGAQQAFLTQFPHQPRQEASRNATCAWGTPKHAALFLHSQSNSPLWALVWWKARGFVSAALVRLPETPGIRRFGQRFGNYLQQSGSGSCCKNRSEKYFSDNWLIKQILAKR